ncbi:unnamed protein product [Lepidochelys kempii]
MDFNTTLLFVFLPQWEDTALKRTRTTSFGSDTASSRPLRFFVDTAVAGGSLPAAFLSFILRKNNPFVGFPEYSIIITIISATEKILGGIHRACSWTLQG